MHRCSSNDTRRIVHEPGAVLGAATPGATRPGAARPGCALLIAERYRVTTGDSTLVIASRTPGGKLRCAWTSVRGAVAIHYWLGSAKFTNEAA